MMAIPLRLFLFLGKLALLFCWIVASYLAAAVIQLLAMYFLSGAASVPRMGWEKMPWALVFSPLYPAMTFDLFVQKKNWGSFSIFGLFLLPFVIFSTYGFLRTFGFLRRA
jgi:hypothetical protein